MQRSIVRPDDASSPAPVYLYGLLVQSVAITVLNTTELDQYHITEAARAIAGIVDELSNCAAAATASGAESAQRTICRLPDVVMVLETLTRICAVRAVYDGKHVSKICAQRGFFCAESAHLTTWPDVNVAPSIKTWKR